MTEDPPRLLEREADDFERSLLVSAVADAPAPEIRSTCLGLLGSGAMGAAGALETAASTGSLASHGGSLASHGGSLALGAGPAAAVGKLALVKWVGVGALLGAATLSTATAVRSPAPQEPVPSTAPQNAVPRPIVTRGRAPVIEPASSLPSPTIPEAEASSSARPPVPPSVQRSSSRPVSSTLSEELRLLDAARVALEQGDGRSAQQALGAYRRLFPRGDLAPEATVLEVQALLALGDRSAARDRAERWFALHPRGAHSERLHALLQDRIP